MKFRVTMKDPDTLDDAIRDAVKAEVAEIQGIDDDERENLIQSRGEGIGDKCRQWFEYGEYLVVEIDTEANTATVIATK